MYRLDPHPKPDVQLVPVTPELLAELARVAAADRHSAIHPTHVVKRGRETIGYASCGAVAMFYAWMDSGRATPRESFTAWNLAEAEMKAAGHRAICLPCERDSPFTPFLERRGYSALGTAQFNLKILGQH